MTTYVLRRVLWAAPVLVGVATLVFLLIHLVPGDPVVSMLGEGATQADVDALRARLGLDLPIWTQYGRFLIGVAQGDLGTSFRYGTPVAQEIARRLGPTLLLAVCAVGVALVVAVPLGSIAALYRNTWVDRVAGTTSLVGVSVPSFWLGPLLALALAVELGWLPVSGSGTWAHVVLPAITLGLSLAAVLVRMVRTALSEELRELYVVAARARGVGGFATVARHALRNSLIPVVTILGLQIGAVLTGAVVTETIFAWPGVGRLLVQAIGFRDYPLVQGCILFIAVIYVLVNLATDLVYGVLDPRVRVQS